MGIERIPEGDKDAVATFTADQMTTVVGERDTYRAALYDATNARLTDVDKVADALGKIDTLHRELHTVSGERDKARRELAEADSILDSRLKMAGFLAEGIRRAAITARERRKNPLRSSRYESERQRRARR
jgi:nucleotidyltransferase/DNA polymerase involved in DNA repair